ncbi:hypothetical protein DAIF1_04310 [Stenotrophomonas indicatrix]|nr:hypothetical protein DAIF1_04310 [Stenotrophomonas indicatrix]
MKVSAAGSGPLAPLRIQCESVCGRSGTGRYTHPIVEATTAWDALMHAGRFWMNSLSALFSKRCSGARCRPSSAWRLPCFGAAGLSALLTALTACTPTADTATNRADLPPVTVQAPSGPAPSQPLDAATLQQRLVAYADSLRETTDASEDAFAKAMKITLTPFEPGRAGGEAENQPMLDGYAFHASYGGLTGGMKVPYHGISVFRPGGKPLTDDPHAPCFWTSAAAGEALATTGYTRGGERAFQRGRLQQYRRTSSGGGTVFYADLLTYVAGGADAGTCVYEVRFAGDVP